MTKLNKFISTLIILCFIMCLASCKEAKDDFYSFDYTPANISKNVNSTFNIFDLSYKTNLPDSVSNSLPNYKQVEIVPENKEVVTLSSITNYITAVEVGKTRINIIINYNNQNILTYFDLTIVDDSQENPNPDDNENNPIPGDSEDKENNNDGENENPTDNKQGNLLVEKFTFKYEVLINLDDPFSPPIEYLLYIYENNKVYKNFKVMATNENQESLLEIGSIGFKNYCTIFAYTFDSVSIDIFDKTYKYLGSILLTIE